MSKERRMKRRQTAKAASAMKTELTAAMQRIADAEALMKAGRGEGVDARQLITDITFALAAMDDADALKELAKLLEAEFGAA